MTGFQALEKIHAARPQIKVMMITSKDNAPEARAKGAMSYILSPTSQTALSAKSLR